MANVKFSRKEFEKHVKITEEIKEKIALFGTPLESLDVNEVELEIFPDRPDLLSLQGWMRSFLAFLGKKTGLQEYQVKKSGDELLVEKSLPEQWPYAFACIVKGLKFDDEKIKEIIDIQEKLGSTLLRNRKKGGIGIYPLEKIKFPIKFIGEEPNKIKFQPLEYSQEITGRQILSKHPTGRDYAQICKNWNKFPIFIDDNKTIMSMPPIINSHIVGKIDNTTKEVFLEATGTDFNMIQKALIIIATTLSDMGGQIYSINCRQQNGKRYDFPDLSPERMKINIENINKLLGLDLDKKQIKKQLEKMGYNYAIVDSEVQIPAYRTDILHEVDIAEDIAIAYGYNNFKPEIPEISTIGEEDKKQVIKRKISDILAGLKLQEISSYHLLTKDEVKRLKLEKIEVKDSKTDYKFLRTNLLANILKTLSENSDSEYPQKIFEIGTIFKIDESKDTGVKESEHLSIALTPSNFTELRQVLEYLAKMLNIEFKFQEASKTGFIEGRTGEIMFNNKKIGIIGEIHPNLLKNYHLQMPLCILELSLENIFEKL